MYRQLYYAGGEGIASLDAGAPSIKYTGDIKPEMASSYIGGPGGPMSQMNDYSMQIYGKPLNELTGDELEDLKNILRTPQASAPSPSSDLYDQFINMQQNGTIPKDMDFDSFKDLIREQASSEGGIMEVAPREQALFGGLKSAVKKVTGAVKDVVSSDIGKAALAGAALYYGGGGNLFGLQRAGLATPGFAFSNLPGASFLGDKFSGIGKSQVGKKLMEGLTSKTALVGLGGAALSLLSDAGLSEEEIQRAQENPEVLKGYLRSSFTRVNPRAEGEDPASYEARVNAFVEENTREYRADGGRMEFADGGRGETLEEKMFREMKNAKVQAGIKLAREKNIGIGKAMSITNSDDFNLKTGEYEGSDETIKNMLNMKSEGGITSIDPDDLPMSKEGFPKYYTPEGKEISFKEFQKAMKDKKPLLPKKKPSRKNKAKGGIMDVPVRQNKAGVKELDYRKKGGFVPPIGIKEKADDIPAMLSNNEFVFTADAVKGMGNGDVDKGAEKLYIMMKKLENGGRV